MPAIAPPLSSVPRLMAMPIVDDTAQPSPPERSHRTYGALVDVAPYLTPALDFSLRIAEQGLAGEHLAALIDDALIDIVIAQEANPDIAAQILDHVANALQQRRPFETVHEVCARALSQKSLRDLRRSIGREGALATPGDVHSWRTHIEHWLGELREFLEQARWAGTGHSRHTSAYEAFGPFQLALAATTNDRTPRVPANSDLANSRAQRVRRDAMHTSTPSPHVQETSTTPKVLPKVSFGESASSPTLQQSVSTFVETLRNRTDSHEAALARVGPVLNLRPQIESKLHRMLSAGATANCPAPSLDNIHLYEFDTFGFARNPQGYDLDHLERRRPHTGRPVVDAALQIVSGHLPISLTPNGDTRAYSAASYGVYTGTLQTDHTYTADEQVPGLSITQLLDATDEWRWLGNDGTSSGAERRLLASLDEPARWLARDDLRLSYLAGDISAEAAVLGELVLSQPNASNRTTDGGEHGRVTTYLVHAGGHDTPVAGLFAASEYLNNGTSLLYVAGDAQPWREYGNPEALQNALLSPSRTTLSAEVLARLPARLIAETVSIAPRLRLARTPHDPLQLASETTLATIRDDIRFNVTQATEPERAARYMTWLAGAAPSVRYRALQASARKNMSPAPGKHAPAPVVLLPENIEESIEAMLDVRLRISLALPDARRIARDMLRDALADLGADALNPDDVRVEIRAAAPSALGTPPIETQPIVKMSLIDATLGKMDGTFPELHSGQVMALTRSDAHASAPIHTTEPLPDADTLMRRVPLTGFRDRLQRDLDGFKRTNTPAIRHDLRTTFILDAIASAVEHKLDADLIALARSVADGAQWGGGLPPFTDAPIHYDREWLSINGYGSTAMLITDRANHKVLMFAPLHKDNAVLGFQHRDGVQKWISEQAEDSTTRLNIVAMFRPSIHATINEYLIENLRGQPSGDDVSSRHALLDAIGAPVVGDTFDAIGERLSEYAESTSVPDRSFDPDAARESVFKLARSLRYFDLALGAGTWASHLLKPLSLSVSVSDAGLGTVLLLGGGEWRREGLKSIATALGTQGIAASKLHVLGRVPGGERFRFFQDGLVDGEDSVVEGLHFTEGRFVARVDDFTTANLAFDPEAAEFRLTHPNTGELGPHMKLGRNGVWRCVPKPAPGDPTTLTDPHVLYDVEKAYGERLRAVTEDIDHAQRQVFRNAKQEAMFRADAARNVNLRTPSAYHKLRFIAPEIVDHAALGAIAGEIESAMDAEASLERIGNIVNEAPSLGAIVTTVQAIAGVESHEIEGGLVRAMAVAVRNSREGNLLTRHGEYALAPTSSATRTYLASLRQLGTSEAAGETIELGGNSALSHGIDSLSSALDGKATTPLTFQLNTPRHTMLFGRRVSELGHPEYFFFDPAVACIVHTDKKVLLELMTRHLKFMRPTYGSFEIPGSPAVVLRRIKVNDLAQAPVSYRSVEDLSRPPALPH